MFGVLVLACIFATCFAGILPPAYVPQRERIVGGDYAPIEERPFQVAIMQESEFWCGGIIVWDKVIVTAAHCFIRPASAYSIRAGSALYNSGGQIRQVELILLNGFDPSSPDKDIALLGLSSPLVLSDAVKVATLAQYGQPIPEGAMSVISGWGSTKNEDVSLILRKTSVPIVNQDVCIKAYAQTPWLITESMFCAGFMETGGHDSCSGDYGGPLTINGILFGIASWGVGCGLPDFPGVYTKIPPYVLWIEKMIIWIISQN